MADSAAYQAEKTLRDNADKIDEELKTEVEEKVKDVRARHRSRRRGPHAQQLDALNASMQNIGEAVYGQGGAGRARTVRKAATQRRDGPAGRGHRRGRVPRGVGGYGREKG